MTMTNDNTNDFIMKVLEALDKQVAELKTEVATIKERLDDFQCDCNRKTEVAIAVEPKLPFVPASFSFSSDGENAIAPEEPHHPRPYHRRQEIIAAQPFIEGLSSMFATKNSDDIKSSPERQLNPEEKKQKIQAFLSGKLCQQCGRETDKVFGESKFGKKLCKKCYYELNGNRMMNNYGKISDFCNDPQNAKEFLAMYAKLRHSPGLIDNVQKQKILDYLASKGLDVVQKSPNTFIDRFYNKIVFNEMAKKIGATVVTSAAETDDGQKEKPSSE